MSRPWLPAALAAAALLAAPNAGATTAAPVPPLECRGERMSDAAAMEQAVCQDPALSALDREVTRLYRLARTDAPGRRLGALDDSQRAWLLRRGDCRNALERPACLRAIHLDRIAGLRLHYPVARDDRGTSRGPVVYDCAGQTLTATFVTGDPALAHLRWRGGGHALAQDGSGGAYKGAGGAEMRIQGTEATVALADGSKLDCRERERRR